MDADAMRSPGRGLPAALREVYLMLAVAVGALAAAGFVVTSSAHRCVAAPAVLLEALPRLPVRAQARAPLRIDSIAASDPAGSRRVRAGAIALLPSDALELRGRARDAATGGRAAAVFAVLDGGAAYRATYDAHTSEDAFSVVVPTDGVPPGRHTVEVRVVAADLRGYYEPAAPIGLVIR